MKKALVIITMMLCAVVTATAQEGLKIGYFSYDNILKSMPEYSTVQTNMEKLRKQYAEELNNAQKEFNEKFELYLDTQARLAESIRQKRQADLQVLLERNEQFSKEAERLLKQAEKEAMAPLRAKVDAAIAKAGAEGGYIAIINTDSNACPYLSPAMASDLTPTLLELTK